MPSSILHEDDLVELYRVGEVGEVCVLSEDPLHAATQVKGQSMEGRLMMQHHPRLLIDT